MSVTDFKEIVNALKELGKLDLLVEYVDAAESCVISTRLALELKRLYLHYETIILNTMAGQFSNHIDMVMGWLTSDGEGHTTYGDKDLHEHRHDVRFATGCPQLTWAVK